MSVIVHGDDLIMVGDETALDWIRSSIQGWFEVKLRGRLGLGSEEAKEVEILGRRVRWSEEGIEVEVDPRLRRKLMEYFGFEDGRTMGAKNADDERREE